MLSQKHQYGQLEHVVIFSFFSTFNYHLFCVYIYYNHDNILLLLILTDYKAISDKYTPNK